jgi:hypothetical protein
VRRYRLCGAALLIALAAAGCGGGSGRISAQQKTADAATKAVYDRDVNGMQAQFDSSLQKQVTIDGVAALSQRLHAFGAYKGLTPTSADASDSRYDYSAAFDSTALAVHVRLDRSGRIAAYRIDVPQQTASTSK